MKRKRSWFHTPPHTHVFCMPISQNVSYFFFQYVLFIIYCINKIKTKKCCLCKFCQNTKHFSFFPFAIFISSYSLLFLRYKKNSSTPSHVYKINIDIDKYREMAWCKKYQHRKWYLQSKFKFMSTFVFLPKFKEKHKTYIPCGMPWRE